MEYFALHCFYKEDSFWNMFSLRIYQFYTCVYIVRAFIQVTYVSYSIVCFYYFLYFIFTLFLLCIIPSTDSYVLIDIGQECINFQNIKYICYKEKLIQNQSSVKSIFLYFKSKDGVKLNWSIRWRLSIPLTYFKKEKKSVTIHE